MSNWNVQNETLDTLDIKKIYIYIYIEMLFLFLHKYLYITLFYSLPLYALDNDDAHVQKSTDSIR